MSHLTGHAGGGGTIPVPAAAAQALCVAALAVMHYQSNAPRATGMHSFAPMLKLPSMLTPRASKFALTLSLNCSCPRFFNGVRSRTVTSGMSWKNHCFPTLFVMRSHFPSAVRAGSSWVKKKVLNRASCLCKAHTRFPAGYNHLWFLCLSQCSSFHALGGKRRWRKKEVVFLHILNSCFCVSSGHKEQKTSLISNMKFHNKMSPNPFEITVIWILSIYIVFLAI